MGPEKRLRVLVALAEIVAVGVAIGVLPLLIGFSPRFLFANRERIWAEFGGGMALGFMMIFFTDLIDDSGGLGESLGLSFTSTQIILISLFMLGFGVFIMSSSVRRSSSASSVYVVAAAIGLHALGEGIVIGSNFVGQIQIEELSTIFQGLSFALHKFLEGFTISLFFTSRPSIRKALTAVLLAGVPLLVGIPLGIFAYPAILANYLFAAGAGAAVFVILRIANLIERNKPGFMAVLGFLVGFLLVYIATLVHFTALP
jgi:zinc transporter ZupT